MPWSLNVEIREIEKISIQLNAKFNIIKDLQLRRNVKSTKS
jgi:hypothetical protein